MAIKKKTFTVRPGKTGRFIVALFLVLFFIAFLLRFDAISQAVAKLTGTDSNKIQSWAGHFMLFTIGLGILWAGLVLVSVPLIGTLLILAGAVMLIYEAVRIFNSLMPGQIKGIKTVYT